MTLFDHDALVAFERAIDPNRTDAQRDLYEVVACGEVSAVMVPNGRADVVLKRQSGFRTAREQASYAKLVREYISAIEARGVSVVETDVVAVTLGARRRTVYLVQRRIDDATLCHQLLNTRSDQGVFEMLDTLFSTLTRFYEANAAAATNAGTEVALDAQLSNWAMDARGALTFFDISTPFLRRGGEHLIDKHLMTRAMPEPLRSVLLLVFAKRVLDRYYDLRQVFTDVLANFIKEGRGEMVPRAVAWTNGWLRERSVAMAPLDADAVRHYYDDDARIWALLARSRRVGRFVTTRLLRQRYDFILPSEVKRR